MHKTLAIISFLAVFTLIGTGCLPWQQEPEIQVSDEPQETSEEQPDIITHPFLDVLGPWHVVLRDEDPQYPPIEGDIIFHADGTSNGNFTGEIESGTYLYENGEIHAAADNGSIEFFATVTGDSATGQWHNMIRDTWGPMTASKINEPTFSL